MQTCLNLRVVSNGRFVLRTLAIGLLKAQILLKAISIKITTSVYFSFVCSLLLRFYFSRASMNSLNLIFVTYRNLRLRDSLVKC